MLNLDEIKRRAELSTDGLFVDDAPLRFVAVRAPRPHWLGSAGLTVGKHPPPAVAEFPQNREGPLQAKRDAELFAHARVDILALIAEVERLQAHHD